MPTVSEHEIIPRFLYHIDNDPERSWREYLQLTRGLSVQQLLVWLNDEFFLINQEQNLPAPQWAVIARPDGMPGWYQPELVAYESSTELHSLASAIYRSLQVRDVNALPLVTLFSVDAVTTKEQAEQAVLEHIQKSRNEKSRP